MSKSEAPAKTIASLVLPLLLLYAPLEGRAAGCGDATDDGAITASDGLSVLRAAVGVDSCDLCVCDADASGTIVASDALLVLRKAVGHAVELACVSCSVTTTIPPTTTTTLGTEPPPTSEDLIEAARERGEIDDETALAYRVFAAFDDPRLPPQYKGDDSHVRDTDALVDLAASLDALSPDRRAELEPFLVPPFYEGSWWDRRHGNASSARSPGPPCKRTQSCVVSSAWASVDTTRVRVWYQTAFGSAEEEKAAALANEVEMVIWPKLSSVLSKEPLSDGTRAQNGGDARLDISLVPLAYYGSAFPYPTTGCAPAPASLLVRRTLVGDILLGTAAHELAHAFQFAYEAGRCARWWLEAMATWAEDFVYPDKNTEHEYLDLLLARPDNSLGRSDSLSKYAAYLLPFFVSNRDGRHADAAFVERVQNELPNHALEEGAIDAALNGGIHRTWPEFVTYNWNRASLDHYRQWENGTLTQGVRTTPSFLSLLFKDFEDGRPLTTEPKGVQPFAANYFHYVINPEDEVRSIAVLNGWTYKLSLMNLGPQGEIFAFEAVPKIERPEKHMIVLTKRGGVWDSQPIVVTDQPAVGLCGHGSDRIEEFVVILANSDQTLTKAHIHGGGDLFPLVFYSKLACDRWQGTITVETPPGEIYERADIDVAFEALPFEFCSAETIEADACEPADTLLTNGFIFAQVEGTIDWEMADVIDDCTYSGSAQNISWPLDPIFGSYTGATNSIITTSATPLSRRASVSVSWPSDGSDVGIEVDYTVACPHGTQQHRKTIGHLWAGFDGEFSINGLSLVGVAEPDQTFFGNRVTYDLHAVP